MRLRPQIHQLLLAFVWLINGLWCKVLDGVPRHTEIVARILGSTYAIEITRIIGFSEMVFALWIATGFRRKWSAITQIVLVLMMNIIEIIFAPDLLLFGRLNLLFALAYCGLIYILEFSFNTSQLQPSGSNEP